MTKKMIERREYFDGGNIRDCISTLEYYYIKYGEKTYLMYDLPEMGYNNNYNLNNYNLFICYMEEETDKEYAKRLKHEERTAKLKELADAKLAERQQKQDYEDYLRLKKKFEKEKVK